MEEELIFGKNPVFHAIESGREIREIIISEQLNKQLEKELRHQLKKSVVPIRKISKQQLDKLVRGKHQGIVAYVRQYAYATVEEILQNAANKDELPFIVILDELEDPHNLGAILRSADAVGAHGVIIPKHRAVGLTATVAKSSAGAIEHVPVARVTNISKTIDMLKEKHIWIVGTDEQGSDDYRTLDGKTAIALVIGNEGKGVSRLVLEKCDWTVHIPMQGTIPSLNASVATSLLLYEIFRKRNPLGDV